jgi:hypothetical protein
VSMGNKLTVNHLRGMFARQSSSFDVGEEVHAKSVC